MNVKDIPLDAIEFTEPDYGSQKLRRLWDAAVSSMADDIRRVGLIHPVLVRRVRPGRYRLIAGRKRLLAYRQLREEKGWRNALPAHIYTKEDVHDAIAAVSENGQRGDPPLSECVARLVATLTPSEQLAFVADVKERMEAEARQRKRSGKKVPGSEKGKTAAKLAALLNRSPAWVERATAVLKAAEEDPENFEKFKQQMDERGRSYCAYERMLDMKRSLAIRAEPVVRHRKENSFVQGDCLDLLRQMPHDSWGNVVTDPPFGLGKTYYGWREPGHSPESFWRWFQPRFEQMYRVVRPGGLVALFLAWEYRHHFPAWFGPYGYTAYNELFVVKRCVDPRKNNRNQDRTGDHGSAYCPLLLAVDPVVMLWKPGGRAILDPTWKGRNRQNWLEADMRDLDPVARNATFPKPVKLMEDIIFRWTVEGTSVLDPFAGSGAACIAAERLGHPWMGIDRSPQACQVAQNRRAWHRENSALPDNNNWSTEQEFWDELHRVFAFTVDAAADRDNAKLPRFWSKDDDALRQDWSQETVWLNPPFDNIESFLAKAKTARLCCAIVPATCLTTRYFKSVQPDFLALPDRRVHFDPPAGPRKKAQHALWGYPLLVYGGLTKGQIAALESMRLAVFTGVPKSLIRG